MSHFQKISFKKFFKSIPDKFKLIDDDILTIFFDLLRTKILLVNFKNNKNQLFFKTKEMS